jgi:ribonuclease P protein component
MAEGRVERPRWATIHVIAASEPGASSRLGLAVSARAAGAVERNRIKRRVRAAFAEAAPAGLDVVVRARSRAATADFQELEDTLRGLKV